MAAPLAAAGLTACAPGAAATFSSACRPGHCRTLRVADSGDTVRVRRGEILLVVLASRGMMWDQPQTTGAAVRLVSARGGYPTTRPARSVFRAARAGKATLTSQTDARCLHSVPPCGISQRGWSVTVVVSKP